jgi:hypothetical protein
MNVKEEISFKYVRIENFFIFIGRWLNNFILKTNKLPFEMRSNWPLEDVNSYCVLY